jgi:hypothetical protein
MGPPDVFTSPGQDPSLSPQIDTLDDTAGFRRGGKVKGFARGGDVAEPAAPSKKKRAVLVRKPAVPVITIALIKKKPTAKRSGGKLEEPPAPYKKGGRVQVPRGSGAAQRGRGQFKGVF